MENTLHNVEPEPSLIQVDQSDGRYTYAHAKAPADYNIHPAKYNTGIFNSHSHMLCGLSHIHMANASSRTNVAIASWKQFKTV